MSLDTDTRKLPDKYVIEAHFWLSHTSLEHSVRVMEFYEYPAFIRASRKLLGADGLKSLKSMLRENPNAGDVIPHGKGLRKLRVALPGGGKSGGARLIYFYFVAGEQCHLFQIYAKKDKETIPRDDVNAYAKLIAKLK
jgi:hypothetical protein